MLSPDLMQLGLMVVGALAFATMVYVLVLPYLSGEKRTEKRIQDAATVRRPTVRGNAQQDANNNRRKQVAETLKELEDRQKSKEKVSLRLRLIRAGLDIEPRTFWLMSLACGVVVGILTLISVQGVPPVVAGVAAFAGAFGLPRWFLKRATKRRHKKFLNEFANSIDVIVRGVKSGLPLNECLGIIARESPQPICGEFQELVEQQRVGVPLADCFDRMMTRMPLPEVKFFAIVIAIQQQAGGNLSEALGNLSSVLRDRKKLQAKVQALSAEAKASAAVLGSLPFIVMILVYITTPGYISLLWTTVMGRFLLLGGGLWMMMGLLVMRKMINFKY